MSDGPSKVSPTFAIDDTEGAPSSEGEPLTWLYRSFDADNHFKGPSAGVAPNEAKTTKTDAEEHWTEIDDEERDELDASDTDEEDPTDIHDQDGMRLIAFVSLLLLTFVPNFRISN